MNGFSQAVFQTDCPLANCHWTSELLSTPPAVVQARRKHIAEHAQSDLVEFVAGENPIVARFIREDPTPAL